MKFTAIFASLLFYVTLSAAWPWPANLFIRDSSGVLQVRQDNNNNNNNQGSSSPAPASTAAQNTASATGSSSPSPTGSGTATSKATATAKPGNTNNKNQTSSISVDPLSPPGGISLLNPATTTTTYYKFGQNITWAWNYTSLIVTPSVVNVLVSCTDTASTFTIAQNISVNATQTVFWDTSKETGANITDTYTLVIYDAGNAAGPSAVPQPGNLAPFNIYTFGMYTPQPYTPIADGYRCVTCNGAMTAMERQAMGVMLAMAGVTVLSFTYFASGFMSL